MFTTEELKALDVQSSNAIDLENLPNRRDRSRLLQHHVLPLSRGLDRREKPCSGAAMAEAGVVGIGRLTRGRGERMVVVVDPGWTGMALFALLAVEEVWAPRFCATDARC